MLYLRHDTAYNAKTFIYFYIPKFGVQNLYNGMQKQEQREPKMQKKQPVIVAMTTNKSVVVNIHSSTESYEQI